MDTLSKKEVRVRFNLTPEYYSALKEMEDGKYSTISAYVRGIVCDHLRAEIDRKNSLKDKDKMSDDFNPEDYDF